LYISGLNIIPDDKEEIKKYSDIYIFAKVNGKTELVPGNVKK